MVILPTHEFYPKRGGIAIYVEETARALQQLGHPVEIWAPASSLLDKRELPFPVTSIKNNGSLGWLDRYPTIKLFLARRKQLRDATLIIAEPGPLLALLYLNSLGLISAKKLILLFHGSDVLRCAQSLHRRKLLAPLLDKADRIGCVSRFTARLLRHYFTFDHSKIRIVSGALRTDFQTLPKAHAHASFCTLLSVARIHPRKGQHCLIEAAQLLPQDTAKNIKFQFVGPIVDSQYQQRLQDTAVKSNISVEFLSQVSDKALASYYSQADVFAQTSTHTKVSVEGFGLSCIEASAAGLPIIAHRSGGLSEAVWDGKTGLLVSPHQPQKLANAIQQLATNPTLRHSLGTAGQLRAKQLSWQANAKLLVD